MIKVVKMCGASGKREAQDCDLRRRNKAANTGRAVILSMFLGGLASGCAQLAPQVEPKVNGVPEQIRPQQRPETLTTRPPASANTAEALDTTTAEQRAEAAAAPQVAERRLGETVASLGSPTEPGFWLKTPLVTTETQGRVVYPSNGKSVAVKLLPIDGPATAGSRMSLPALRLIEAPLTGLPVVVVYAN